MAVGRKRNQIAAVSLLVGPDLTDTVTAMDALLTQRRIAQVIRIQHGHYLMVVKRNQCCLLEALELFFHNPPIAANAEHWDRVQSIGKGHSRIESRTLDSSSRLCAYLAWPRFCGALASGRSSSWGRVSCDFDMTLGQIVHRPRDPKHVLCSFIWYNTSLLSDDLSDASAKCLGDRGRVVW